MRCIWFYLFLVWILIIKIHQAGGVFDHEIADYKKIIFFYEILQRVEKPLQYDTWKRRGDKLQFNKAFYKEYNKAMELLQEDLNFNGLLKQETFFSELVKFHSSQAEGLFHFLFQALDWETFVQNACWARQHVNAHMFVYIFTMAAVQRQLDHAMLLPRIYEILPRYFLPAVFVNEIEQFENTAWLDDSQRNVTAGNGSTAWQSWITKKPVATNWHAVDIKNIPNDTIFGDTQCVMEMKALWHASDYTRDFKIMNKHAKLSYFTEDVDWNTYWYLLNIMNPSFLRGKDMIWNNAIKHAEFWLYSLQQLLVRYEMERLSHDFPETPMFEWYNQIESGYSPLLIDTNGKNYIWRENLMVLQPRMENFEMLHECQYALQRIEEALQFGYYFLQNGTKIDLQKPESLQMVNNLLHCNIDAIDQFYNSNWYQLAIMYLADTIDQKNYQVQPHVLLNFETMLRDPLFYIFHKRIVDNFHRSREFLPPYTNEELHIKGLHIVSVHVSQLETYFDLYDLDASNLLQSNKKHNCANTILARQMRLTHKPFFFNFTIISPKSMTALLRIFLAPKNVAHNSRMSLDSDRKNYFELNKITVNLKPGINKKTFHYEHHFPSSRSQSESFQLKMYFDALSVTKRMTLLKDSDPQRNCGLHTRLLLPRGSASGLKMQLFFMVTQLSGSDQNIYPWWKLCVPIQEYQSFGFPFDREIRNSHNFIGTNMYWKDIEIYHKETNLMKAKSRK